MRRRIFIKTTVVAVLVAVVISIAVVVASGAGDGDNRGARQTAAGPAALTTPSAGRWVSGSQPLLNARPVARGTNDACPQRKRSRPRPADFPASFPLPAGMVLTEVRHVTSPVVAPVVYLIGFAPVSLKGAARFFVRELPRSGYYITSSEAEPIEVEARFDGPAKGALKVLGLPACSSAVWMLIGVSKART